VAHYRATGSERLLDVATRFADHICDTFGPEEGKRQAVDGHEEVEMALVELFRATLVLNDKESTVRFEPYLLGGVAVLQAEARSAPPAAGWEDCLYRTVHPPERDTQTHPTRVTLVPYYAWANREPGAMRVWLRNG
jgi:DUF1680 family protein